MMDVFYFLGNLASIVGLIITFIVWYQVSDIKKNFIFVARIPEIITALGKNASEINKCFMSYDKSMSEMSVELGRCLAILNNLVSKVDGDTKNSVNALILEIKSNYKVINADSKQQLYNIYTELNIIIETLRNEVKDRRWK